MSLVDLSNVDGLAFTSVEVFTLLVRIILAAPLVVSVFTSFMRRAVRTLNGLVVLLYSCCMACKEEPDMKQVYLNTAHSDESQCDCILVSVLSLFLATLKMERRESTSSL